MVTRPHKLSYIFYCCLVEGRPRGVAKRSQNEFQPLDNNLSRPHTETKMQLSGNNKPKAAATLVDLRRGDAAVLERIELPTEEARRLMELGFLPGTRITAGLSAPGGDPRVFQVDGSEVALRRETARLMKVRLHKTSRPS